jgi:hypothetical protein
MLYVERHYLRKYSVYCSESSLFVRRVHVCVADASFAENFYGLKRRRRPYIETERARAAVGGVPVEEKLRDREVWRSLIVLVRSINIDSVGIDRLTRC